MGQYITGNAPTSGDGSVDFVLRALRDALLGSGWVTVDTLSTTPGLRDVVLKSAPIDDIADNRCFIRLRQFSSTSFGWNIYSDWDATLSVGANVANTDGLQVVIGGGSFNYVFRVNEWSIATLVVPISGGPYYKGYAGFVRRMLRASKSGCTKTTAPYAIGTGSMSVASDMTTRLKVGQRVLVYNQSHDSTSPNFGNAEVLTIQSIAAGSITFTGTTAKAYDTGAVIGQLAYPGVINTWTTSSFGDSTGYMPFSLDGTRTGPTSHTAVFVDRLFPSDFSTGSSSTYLTGAAGLTTVNATGVGVTGAIGILWHFACTLPPSGIATTNDIMDDGDNTYLLAGSSSGTGGPWTIIGPQ